MVSNRFALLIGVSKYGNGFYSLPGSLQDIEELRKVLEDPELGTFQKVELMKNPTGAEIQGKVENFFDNREKDDLLLLYFSGHGDLGKSIAHQRLHLCGSTSYKNESRLVETSAVSAEFIKRQMAVSKSKRIIVILDCCFSGAISEMLRKGETSVNYSEFASNNDHKKPGTVILASSSADQVTYQLNNGLSEYTSCLIKGMKGHAKTRYSEWLEAQDLHEYAVEYFKSEKRHLAQPKIVVTNDEGYRIPVVRTPKRNPKESYQQEVEELFEVLASQDLEFNGDIQSGSLGRHDLDIARDKLGLSHEDAQEIEARVRPYVLKQSQDRIKYRQAVEKACGQNFPLTVLEYEILERISKKLTLHKDQDLNIEIAKRIEEKVFKSFQAKAANSPALDISKKSLEIDPKPMGTLEKSNKLKRIRFEVIWLDIQPGNFLGFGLKLTKKSKFHESKYFIEVLDDNISLELVNVPDGKFWMGAKQGEEGCSKDEYPCHEVTIAPFFLSKTQVTQAQWKFVAELPKVSQDLRIAPSYFKGDTLPVEQVSWDDTKEFCARLSQYTNHEYRLPTEAEWEYTCRAGTNTPFCFGETISTELANYNGDSVYGKGQKGECREKTISVSSFSPNAFGLCDMHGNVWEWCADYWHINYKGAPTDGSPWYDKTNEENHRVLRGGSWEHEAKSCRSAMRNLSLPNERRNSVGFRVACSISELCLE